MKISYNWLKDHIDTNLRVDEIEPLLTFSGLEVESFEEWSSVKGALKGLVIGEVLEKQKHPNADRLNLTKVDIGTGEILSIVCGASNVEAGQKVVVAPVGCTVNPTNGEPFIIQKSKIRGELSEGMICAEDEIGLGTDHAGIMVLPPDAKVGTLAADYFKIENDFSIEIGLTANRGDAASHRGVARDLAALLRTSLKPIPNLDLKQGNCPVDIVLESAENCPRYTGILLKNIQVKESPDWLKNRLKSLGLNPINNVVDVTNFVLHDLGQPIHAFDASKIEGKQVVIRQAKEGEEIITLDGNTRKLSAEDLVIANANKAMAIAGVFGGKDSGVSESTTEVFIESAYFNPASIRKTAKRHALSTDASFRYERGTDPEITISALKRVVQLLKELAGAECVGDYNDVYPKPIPAREIKLRFKELKRIIGQEIPAQEVKEILQGLEINIKSEHADGFLCVVPTLKPDVEREIDLIEEVLRIYGLNKIEFPGRIQISMSGTPYPSAVFLRERMANTLVANGYLELGTNSMTKMAYYGEQSQAQAIKMMNPLSADLEIMRMSMIPSLLEAISYNLNRKNSDLRFFDFGKIYKKQDSKIVENSRLLIGLTGNYRTESWFSKPEKSGVFHLKQLCSRILASVGLEWSEDLVHYDVLANDWPNEKMIELGVVSNNSLQAFDINQEVFVANLDLDQILNAASNYKPKVEQISKFPDVKRDLSLVLDKAVSYADLLGHIKSKSGKTLKSVSVFDVYEGDRIESGKKAYALRFIFNDSEKTLTDETIESLMNKIIKTLESQTAAYIRK